MTSRCQTAFARGAQVFVLLEHCQMMRYLVVEIALILGARKKYPRRRNSSRIGSRRFDYARDRRHHALELIQLPAHLFAAFGR